MNLKFFFLYFRFFEVNLYFFFFECKINGYTFGINTTIAFIHRPLLYADTATFTHKNTRNNNKNMYIILKIDSTRKNCTRF